jgi:type I restriction enzyme S subunit
MQQLLTGQTRLPGIHGEWEVKTLGDTCTFENGDRGENYPSLGSFVHSGIPFVNAGHVENGRISRKFMDYITRESFDRLGGGKFKAGDILFCLRGSLGKFGVVDLDFGEGAIASSLVIIRPKLASLYADYLSCYFKSQLCAQMIERWAGGAAQPNLGAQDLSKFRIRLPSIPEQIAIAAVLTDMDAELTALEQRLTKTRALKQGMMQELLTGRTRLV